MRVWLWLILALLLVGCGGGAPPRTSPGRAELRILWNTPTGRLLPRAARSLKVVVRAEGSLVEERIVARPALPEQTSTLLFERLPATQVRFEATAYPQPDATGTPQAQAQVTVSIVADQKVSVPLTLASRIVRVKLTPENLTLGKGASATVQAQALDAQNHVVLTDPTQWQWQGSTGLTLTAKGLQADIVAEREGSLTVTATEKESGISGTLSLSGVAGKAVWPNAEGGWGNAWQGGTGGTHSQLAWQKHLDASVVGMVLGRDDALYVMTQGQQSGSVFTPGRLYALDPRTGEVRWSSGSGSAFAPALSPAGETLFLTGSGDQRVIAVETSTGVERGAANLGAFAARAPLVTPGGRVVVLTAQAELVAFRASDLTLLWRRSVATGTQLTCGPDDTLYTSEGETRRALRASDGSVVWQQAEGMGIPWVSTSGQLYGGPGALSGYHPQTGARLWTQESRIPTDTYDYLALGTPVLSGQSLAVGGVEVKGSPDPEKYRFAGKLYFLSTTGSGVLGEVPLASPDMRVEALASNRRGGVYLDAGGALWLYDGAALAPLPVAAPYNRRLAVGEGGVYLANDQTLTALR